MKLKYLLIAAAITIPLLSNAELIKKTSPDNVKITMDRFESILKSKGIQVFARIDHKENAKSVKMTLNDNEVIIFGKPDVGTKIMYHDAAIGLDLPMRVSMYKDFDDKTQIVYHNPQSLEDNFKVSKCAAINKITNLLDKLTDKAAKISK